MQRGACQVWERLVRGMCNAPAKVWKEIGSATSQAVTFGLGISLESDPSEPCVGRGTQ